MRELGGGGFGCVFLAKDTVAGIEVAVKGLPPEVRHNREELENIRANFALVSRLHHPNIAAALDYAHGEKIVHRDVKPSNVMIETNYFIYGKVTCGATGYPAKLTGVELIENKTPCCK